jgi:hypothetical protein
MRRLIAAVTLAVAALAGVVTAHSAPHATLAGATPDGTGVGCCFH